MFDKFFDATRAQYITRPESAASELVYRHPNTTVPRGAKLTVRSDEEVVFFREGRVAGTLKPGAYILDTANIPFLGSLVNVVTGGNHYLAEVFFVRTAETPLGIGGSELGSFVDVNSRNLLRVLFDARVTVSVTDGTALITQLGGQSSQSGSSVEMIVSGRLRNALKSHIAAEAQRVPIYQIISNADSEDFGTAVSTKVAAEFHALGLRFARFLDLHLTLDEESMGLLRAYQKREADLVIDAKGAQVAADPGFATYNAVKGGRTVAEGLGSGLSRGFSGPVIGMGLGGFGGVGGIIPGAGVGAVQRGIVPQQESSAPLPRPSGGRGPDRFIVDGPKGPEGPYSARQVALWILGAGTQADSVRIRFEQDPPDMWTSAASEPSIYVELTRRRGGGSASVATSNSGSTSTSPFEIALAQAISDRRITSDEMALLASLAVSGRFAASNADARTIITQRALAANCVIEAAEAVGFAYWNGSAQELQLSAAAVAERVRATPSGTHMVWTASLGNWTDARAVPDIAVILAQPPSPPSVGPPPPPGSPSI